MSMFAGVQGLGGYTSAEVAEVEKGRMQERERVKNRQERLIKERADLVRRYFYNQFGQKIATPPPEAIEEEQRLATEIEKLAQELREIDSEADRRRYEALPVDELAEQARAELEELRRQRRVYCHRVYILRRTPELQNLNNIEERITEVENQLQRYELAADARDELASA